MTAPRKYANPPVVEALCEVYFADARWDETVPGRFFDRVQGLGFSLKEPVQRHEAQVLLGGESGPSAAVRQEARMRFRSADRAKVVQLERDMIVVNQLRPYPTFADWAPSVRDVAKTFSDLVEPKGVSRVSLRYINQIDLPGTRIDLEEWFTVTPKLPHSWMDAAGSFVVRAERRISDHLMLILTFGSAPRTKPQESSFMLDFYALHSLPAPVGVDEIAPLMETAHAAIESAFEGSITSQLRSRFDEPLPS